MQSVRADTAGVLLTKRFEVLQGFLKGFQTIFKKNMDNAISYNIISNILGTRLHDKTMAKVETKEIEKTKRLLAKHNKFYEELQFEYDECKHTIQHSFPKLIDYKGEIKDKDVWILECCSLLNAALDIVQIDRIELKETVKQMENIVTLEVIVRDIIHDADTYKSKKYLEHIQKCGNMLGDQT